MDIYAIDINEKLVAQIYSPSALKSYAMEVGDDTNRHQDLEVQISGLQRIFVLPVYYPSKGFKTCLETFGANMAETIH